MALVSMTKRQIRQAVMLACEPSGAVLVNQTGTITSVTQTTLANAATVYEDNHWKGGWMRAVVTSGTATETKRITSFTGSTGAFVHAAYSGARDTSPIDILRANTTFDEYDSAVERALRSVARLLIVDQGDRSLCLEPGRYALPVPTGFVSVDFDGVWVDRSVPDTGYNYTAINSEGRTEYAVGSAATNLRRSQGFQISSPMYLGAVWVPLRKFNNGATLTVRIESDSSGLPNGLVEAGATTTIATSAVGTSGEWVKATFSTPPYLQEDTQYHVVVQVGSDNASDYSAWIGDTQSTYGLGDAGIHNGAWAAVSGTSMLFRLQHVDALTNWQRLDKNEWRILTESTRTLHIRPQMGLSVPTPVKLIGQGFQTSLEGVTNEGTTCTVDPEVVTKLAIGMYLEMKAAQATNGEQARIAVLMQREAMERLAALRPLIRGRKVERQ